MKRITVKQYAAALYELTKDLPASKIDKAVEAFLSTLKKNQVLSKIDSIMGAFTAYAKKQEGILELGITSAHPLDKKMIQQIAASFGKQAETAENVNPALIGGVIVRSGDVIFDGSAVTQIKKLQEQLQG